MMKFSHKLFLLAQDSFITLSGFISPEIIHNSEKHSAIKKFLFYKRIEGVSGDYLEFGVYEGTSLKGAVHYWRKISRGIGLNNNKMRFFGFDSFKGMKPEKGDDHSFYTNFDFSTDIGIIKKRFKNFPEVRLIPGFFDSSLAKGPEFYGIKKASVVMVDCDLYSSSREVFSFITPLIQPGTVLILDDFFNYKADKSKGVRAAFNEFLRSSGVSCEEVSRYGIGGVVFVITNINSKSDRTVKK